MKHTMEHMLSAHSYYHSASQVRSGNLMPCVCMHGVCIVWRVVVCVRRKYGPSSLACLLFAHMCISCQHLLPIWSYWQLYVSWKCMTSVRETMNERCVALLI